jgi:methyl-accepting chemotaxis protein
MTIGISGRLLGLGAAGFIGACAVGISGFYSLNHTHTSLKAVSVTGEALRNHLECDMMHDALRGDVLSAFVARTEEEKEQARADLKDHADWFRRSLAANKALDLPREVKALLTEIEPALDTYILGAERISSAALESPEQARQELPEFAQAFTSLEGRTEKLSEQLMALSNAETEAAGERFSTAAIQIGAVLGGSLLVSAVLGILIGRGILLPLRSCLSVMEALANGDLSRRAGVRGEDELARLAMAADGALDRMSLMVTQIRSLAGQVAAAATEVTASSEEMSADVASQAREIAEIDASIREMASATDEVAGRATEANSAADESGKLAESGGTIVADTVTEMKGISQAVSAGAASVGELGKRGEQIGQIIAVINDIADQTNLLALNAAIEAARAGEHGRGFAVVADEVRKLADRTTKATEEIGVSIRAIQQETGQAVSKIGAGSEQVGRGVERAIEAGLSLSKIVASSRKVGEMVGLIATAAQQQMSVSRQVAERVGTIRQSTERTTVGSTQAAQAAASLSGKAEELSRLVAAFKLTEDWNSSRA